MPYVEDENDNPIIDENGDKITFTFSHGNNNDPPYVHREMLHIDDDGYINTENRHIVIKDGVNQDHAVSKAQLDNTKAAIINLIPSSNPVDLSIPENAIKELVESTIKKSLKQYNNNLKKMINKRMKGRIGKKSLQIPKSRYT